MQTFPLKFLLLGDSGVGKTQLLRHQTSKPFDYEHTPTSGIQFSTCTLDFEKSIIKAQVWDTLGKIRRNKMMKTFFQDAVGVALVYDITNRESYENVKNHWIDFIKEMTENSDINLVLIGNKKDLNNNVDNSEIDSSSDSNSNSNSKRQVTVEEAVSFAKEKNLDLIEVSALTGDCVDIAFRRLILGSARRLPDIKLHLELNSLPDGWILYIPPLKQEIISSSVSTTSPISNTSLPLPIQIPHKISRDISDNKPMLSRSASDKAEIDSTDQLKEVGRILQYMNYWSGKVQNEVPLIPSPTYLLFTSIINRSISTSEASILPSAESTRSPSKSFRLNSNSSNNNINNNKKSSMDFDEDFDTDNNQFSITEQNKNVKTVSSPPPPRCNCIIS